MKAKKFFVYAVFATSNLCPQYLPFSMPSVPCQNDVLRRVHAMPTTQMHHAGHKSLRHTHTHTHSHVHDTHKLHTYHNDNRGQRYLPTRDNGEEAKSSKARNPFANE